MKSGTTVQRQVSEYLQYELYHILGAYGIAERSHRKLADDLDDLVIRMSGTQSSTKESNPHAAPPRNPLAIIADLASRHNWQLGYQRHGRPQPRKAIAAGEGKGQSTNWPFREPIPDDLPLTKVKRFKFDELPGVEKDRENPWKESEVWERIGRFYSEAISALEAWEPVSESEPSKRKRKQILADSIITQLDHAPSISSEDRELVERRTQRYMYRLRCAHDVLAVRGSPQTEMDDDELRELYAPEPRFRRQLYYHSLSTEGDSLPLFVVTVLAEAHLSMHAVEAWQRMALGERAKMYTDLVKKWLDEELDQCIELNTFAYSVSRTAPWLFGADTSERGAVFRNSSRAWEHARPARGMWIAGQIGLLALHRRAYARALKGEPQLAYNDYYKLQRLIRDAERRLRGVPIQVDGALEFLAALDAQAHHHIGELYRAEHAHRQARRHFNVASERLKALRRAPASPAGIGSQALTKLSDVLRNSRCTVELQVSYGKACYEMGRHKEALCWHLRGWKDFLELLAEDTGTTANTDAIQRAIVWLEFVRYQPELRKSELVKYLRPVIDQVERVTVSARYGALAGEILLRLGHLLLVINLREFGPEGLDGTHTTSGDTFAIRCLKRARECDTHSSMIIADLLKAGRRLERAYRDDAQIDTEILSDKIVPVGDMWPRGGTDFERLARASEYLTLRKQRVARVEREGVDEATGKARIAHGLLSDFFMNTDSINVRKSQGYSLLMKDPRPSRLPSGSDVAIEFICMRRYSSFFPLLPRPSAFRALCGGYFIRLHSGHIDPSHQTEQRHSPETDGAPVGIVIDPGVDFVETLYRAGYALNDINIIVVTHDHVDHAGSLDTLVSLLHVRARTLSAERRDNEVPAVTFLLSRSVDARFAGATGLREHEKFKFQCIEDLMDSAGHPYHGGEPRALPGIEGLPDWFELIPMSTKDVDGVGHLDLSGTPAFGVCIRRKGERSGGVAFTSDTPAPPPRHERVLHDHWVASWAPALHADVLVAHLSSVPLTELRQLAEKDGTYDQIRSGAARRQIEAEEQSLRDISKKLQQNHTVSQGLIEYGLWLRSAKHGDNAPIVGSVPSGWMAPSGQAFLRGLLRWAKAYRRVHRDPGQAGLFVVGELSEELGTMRSKVAASINDLVFKSGTVTPHPEPETVAPHAHALSGDIGLDALVTWERGADETAQVRVLCATCSLDADRVPDEQYHVASEVLETCIKGENEGIFYNCREHAPTKERDSVFLEQLERFDIFGR